MRFGSDDTSALHKHSIIVLCPASSTIEVQQQEHYLEGTMFSYVPRLLLVFAVTALIGCGLQTSSTPTTILAPTILPTAHLAVTNVTYTVVSATSLPTRILATAVVTPHPTSAPQPSATSIPSVTPSVEWVSKQFDPVWNISYPKGWQVNEGGVYEGHIDMRGSYEDHEYEISFSYPIFEPPFPVSLEDWVRQTLQRLSEQQRAQVTISDITVAGTAAKKIRNLPDETVGQLTHQVYIWSTGDKNPRWINIRQIDKQPTDSRQMERLFDQILAGVA
jgi:hypothetical protein